MFVRILELGGEEVGPDHRRSGRCVDTRTVKGTTARPLREMERGQRTEDKKEKEPN